MNFKKRVIGIILISSTLLLVSWADNWDELKQGSKKINSISSGFIQKKHLDILSKPLVSTGKLFFKRPSSLRWEYTSPIKSILLMHDSNIKRYIMQNGKLVPDRGLNLQAMQVVVQEISFWLSGEFDKNPNFIAELKRGNTSKIILTPREETLLKIIKKIEVFLSSEPGIIKKVLIFENRSNYTELIFSNPMVNKGIDDKKFKGI